MTATPWYHDGLKFRCTQCGICCTGEPGVVWVNEQEIRRIAEYRGEPVEEVRRFYTVEIGPERRSLRERKGGDCIFFDAQTRGCTIYPVRPRQCRSYPFWDSNLRTPKDWEQTCRDCPGAGRGDHFTLVQIEERRSLIRI